MSRRFRQDNVATAPDAHGTPLVSIVIPCHGREELFNDTLWSCLEQDYERFEVVVVDDCSAPPLQISYRSPRIRAFRLRRNVGQSGARNYGIRKARGDYIKLLDSDDLFVDSSCLRRFAEFAGRTQADYLHCDAQLFDVTSGRVGAFRPMQFDERILKGNFIAPSQMLIRRSLFEKVCFPEEIRYSADWAFTLAVYRAGNFQIRHFPQRLITLRLNSSSLSQSYGNVSGAYIKAIERHRRHVARRCPPH